MESNGQYTVRVVVENEKGNKPQPVCVPAPAKVSGSVRRSTEVIVLPCESTLIGG